MAELMKHVGSYGEKPCVVVFREVPNEPDNCLIVESASLEDSKHDDLMNIVASLEAQESNNVSEVLSRRQFSDGTNILNDLHFSKKLIKVPVDMVFLTPTPSQKISLQEVNAEINKLETGSNPPLNVDVDPDTLQTPNPVEVTGDASAAEGLLVQAEMIEQDAKQLMEDAESKKAEAYKLDPSLKPKKSKAK
tara:strand:+ start:41075 stop:41650 length:576 start_codon:yes stop_codon:yes gene_type:complete